MTFAPALSLLSTIIQTALISAQIFKQSAEVLIKIQWKLSLKC